MPLISVIIPVYNGEKTIRETIESVLNQSLSDFELIVVNDGSQDRTLQIVNSIKDSRIKVFSHPNAGPNPTRNLGVSHAVGEYVSFIDADDLWTSDKLVSQLSALQENPGAAVAYSWTNYIDEWGQFLRRGTHLSVTGDVYKHLLLIYFLENCSNALIRRLAFTAVGGFDESLTHAEDWELYLRLAARYHFVAVRSPQILYRVYANSNSSNVAKQEAGCLEVINRAFSQVPESLMPLKKYSLGNLYKYLTSKALEGPPARERSFAAARFLWYAVKCDRSLLRTRVIFKVLLKIAVILFLPPQQAQAFFAKFKKLANTTTILGYMQLDPC